MSTLLEAAKALCASTGIRHYQICTVPVALVEALEQAIAQELASQTASTNPVVSQKAAGTVDKYEDTRNALTDKRFAI